MNAPPLNNAVNEQCAKDLAARLKDLPPEETIGFLGAGLSRPDYPSWDLLVTELYKQCGLNPPSEPIEHLQALEHIRTEAINDYIDYLANTFNRVPHRPKENYTNLLLLRLGSYITTNFDLSLSVAARRVYAKASAPYVYPQPFQLYQAQKSSCFYIHGTTEDIRAETIDDIVLHQSAYTRAYSDRSAPLADFLCNIFNERNVLFVGYSLKDPPIRYFLETLRQIASLGFSKRTRLALFSTELPQLRDHSRKEEVIREEHRESADFKENMCVDILRYDPEGDSFSGLTDVLLRVLDLTAPTIPHLGEIRYPISEKATI